MNVRVLTAYVLKSATPAHPDSHLYRPPTHPHPHARRSTTRGDPALGASAPR